MISVIIPTLNEKDLIGISLTKLLENTGDFEVIVSDGGSADGTLSIVSSFPEVKRVVSGKGRGRQMNEGAKVANGDILLFLHADTYLPEDAFIMIERAMSCPKVCAGAFSINYDHSHPMLRLYSLFTRLNHVFTTYGDQALFVRKDLFLEIGGFKDIPIMEDVEIQRRIRSRGGFVKISSPALASSRRFIKNGVIRQQILNITLVLLYYLGISPARLKRFYRDCL